MLNVSPEAEQRRLQDGRNDGDRMLLSVGRWRSADLLLLLLLLWFAMGAVRRRVSFAHRRRVRQVSEWEKSKRVLLPRKQTGKKKINLSKDYIDTQYRIVTT